MRYIKYLLSAAKCLYIKLFYNVEIPVLRTISNKTIFDINGSGKIIVGHKVETTGEVVFQAHSGEITIGDRCYFNRNSVLCSHEHIMIGNHCLFGPNVLIYDHDHVFNNGVVTNEYRGEDVLIGDNCWIGAGVIILKGSVIGEGSVIGAGSVISGIVPSHSTVISKHNMIIKERNDLV